eukprot:Gb_25123 [translate_table: standard]
MNGSRVNRLRQIVHLRRMMKRWHTLALSRKVSTVTGCAVSPRNNRRSSSSSFSYDSDEECCRSPASTPPDVPEGYLAVYVGMERKRFIIPTSYLSRPVFRTLLQKAEEEFGFDHKGGLTIPCETVIFEEVLRVLGKNGEEVPNCGLDDLVNRGLGVVNSHSTDSNSSPLLEKSFGRRIC